MKNHTDVMIFHTAICAENVTNSPYPTRETAFAAFSCGSSNVNVLGMEDNMNNKNSCGLLIKQIHTTLEKNANNRLRADGLTSAQFAVMMVLGEREEHSMTLKELERELRLAQSTIAGTVSRLAAKKLVFYSDSPEDGRIKYVHLTEAGIECCRKAVEHMEDTEERLLSKLTDTERDIFITLLQKVNQAIQ